MPDSPFIEVDFDGASDGNGLVTGAVTWWLPDRDSAWGLSQAAVDGVPFKRFSSVRPHPEQVGYQAVLEYEGLVDGIDPPEDESRQWNIQITARMDPIETCPNFAELKKTYGGVMENGKVRWPETIPLSKSSGGFGSSKTTTQENPMQNVTHYPVLLGQAVYTRMVRNPSSDLLKGIGAVIESLPSSARTDTPEGYVWIRSTPGRTGFGNAFRLTDTYKLERKEGWVYQIQKIIGQ